MDQPTPHHDGRTEKRRSTTHAVQESEILTPGKSKVFVITSTPKKRRLDPLDSSTVSHQDEGNSGFIDPIDIASDYLSDQLRFFLNQLRLR
jgi:hypothetical protein